MAEGMLESWTGGPGPIFQGQTENVTSATTDAVARGEGGAAAEAAAVMVEASSQEAFDYIDSLCHATDAETVDLAMVRLYRAHRARMRAEKSQRDRQARARRRHLRQWERMRCLGFRSPRRCVCVRHGRHCRLDLSPGPS